MSDNQALLQPVADGKEEIPFEERALHIDEFLDSSYHVTKLNLAYVHFVFSHFRKPAVDKMMHDQFMRQFKLFVDFEGRTWRVTGASRFGDIWLQSRFDQDHGYDRRVALRLNEFQNWRDKSDFELSWEQRWTLGVTHYDVPAVGNGVPPKASRHVNALNGRGVPARLLEVPQQWRPSILQPTNAR